MAEVIDIRFEDEQFNKSAEEMNKKLEKLEAQADATAAAFSKTTAAAANSADQASKRIELIVSQTSQTTRTRGISAAQRQLDQARLEAAGPLDRFQKAQLDFERDISGKFAGNDKFIEKRTAIYKQYIAVLAQLELQAKKTELSEERLAQLSKSSIAFTSANESSFQAALNEANRRAKLRQGLLSSLTYETATPVERISLRRTTTLNQLQGAGASAAEVKAAEEAFKKLENQAVASSKNIGARIAEFITSPTYAARKSLGDFLQDFGKFGIIAGGILLGVGVAAYKAFSIVRESGKFAEDIDILSNKLGTNVIDTQRLANAANVAGVSIDSLDGFMRKLSQGLVNGGQEGKIAAEGLDKIGVKAFQVGGQIKPTLQLMLEISAAINKLPKGPQQIAAFSNIGGRGALELLPLFQELPGLIQQSGNVLSKEMVDKLKDADDKLDVMANNWKVIKGNIAGAIIDLTTYHTLLGDTLGIMIKMALHGGKLPEPPTDFKGFKIGDKVSLAEHRDIAAADKLIEQFKLRAQTAEDLTYRIQKLNEQLTTDVAAANASGAGTAAIRAAQQKVLADRAQLDILREQLKIINGIDAAQKAANAEAIKATKNLQDAQAANKAALAGGPASQLQLTVASAKALDDYRAAQQKSKDEGFYNARIEASLRKTLLAEEQTAIVNYGAARIKEIQEEGREYTAYVNEKLKQERDFQSETLRLAQETADARLNFEETIAANLRDAQIRAIERTDAKTLQQAVGFELQKGAIQTQYEEKALQVRLDAINRAAEAEKRTLEARVTLGLNTNEQYQARILELDAATAEKERQITIQSLNAIQKEREDAAIKAAQAITDANTKVFDNIKSEANGLLDAFFSKSQSVGQAIGAIFKAAFLTPIKDALSTQISAKLTGLVTGQQVGLSPGTLATGPFGDIARRLGIGARPTFGAAEQVRKIEQAGHLGDVVLRSTAAGSAVPVFIANPESIQQQVDVKSQATSTQVNQAITLGSSAGGGGFAGGITRPPLAALLAVLAASPVGAFATPAGFTPAAAAQQIEQVTSKLGGTGGEGLSGRGGPDFNAIQRSLAPGLGQGIGKFAEAGGGGFAGAAAGSSLQDILGGSRNAFVGGAVDANGIPINTASERLTSILSQTGYPGTAAAGAAGIAGSAGSKGLFSFSGIGSLFQKIGPKGFAALGIPIGLGLLSASTKQPYGAKSTASAGLGGALAGFGIGAQFGLGFAGAEIGAGAGLLISGLQTGGGTGFAKDVAGGALAGLGIAGPIGAVVGAGVGALLGGLSLAGIIQTKNQKFHQKIKDLYHVDITDQKVLSQFSQIADQKYGGNVDIAVRSIEVRQIVQLWAQAHGQNSLGIVGTPQQSIFANQGGRYTEIPTYFNGQAVVPGDTRSTIGIPQLTPNGSYITVPAPGGANVAQGGSISLSLDADATTRVLQGQAAQVIQGQPRLISQQTQAGMGASSARRDIASSVLQPAFLTT